MPKAYHLGDVKSYRSCPRLFFLMQRTFRTPYFSFIQLPMSLKEALIQKVKASDYALGYRGMDATSSFALYQAHVWSFNLRFEAKGLRVKVPGLYRGPEGTQLYFTSLSMNPRIEDKNYFASILWVLQQNGIEISKIQVMYLNKDYIRQDGLDIDACFHLSSDFIKNTGHNQGDILEHCLKRPPSYEEDLLQMAAVDACDTFELSLEECPLKEKCEAFETCFKAEHTLVRQHQLERLVERGLDPKETDQPLSRTDYAQIQAFITQKRFVDFISLKNWLNNVSHPTLTFVDFEWDTYGLPPYAGMHPMDVLPFQFSMHIKTQEGLQHREFLGDGDCREAFIQSFLNHIPSEGPIFAYNAFGAEVIRLQHLARQFPVYEEALNDVIARFVDLASLFVGGVIYDEKMQGSFSLKNLIKAIDPDLSYETLAIKHGMEAVMHYRTLQDEEGDEVKRQALLSYCHMDTLAMVKVFEWCEMLLKEEDHA